MTRSGGGLGALEVLFVIFLVLKLSKMVTWSWWVVFTPILLAAIFWLFIYGANAFDAWTEERQRRRMEDLDS